MFSAAKIVLLSVKFCSSDLNIQKYKSFIKIFNRIGPVGTPVGEIWKTYE